MDYFAHGIWSYILFHHKKHVVYAVLFGLLPDSLSFAPYTIYRVFTKGFEFGKPDPAKIPDIVYLMYGISHSLIVVAVVFLIVFIFLKKVPYFMWTWPLAISIDVLTHKADFLPTPFLWPVSDYGFDGISWASSWFMITNYSLIILVSLLLVILHFRKKRQS